MVNACQSVNCDGSSFKESVGILACVWVHAHVCLSIPDKFECHGAWLDLSYWQGDVAEHVGLETVGA